MVTVGRALQTCANCARCAVTQTGVLLIRCYQGMIRPLLFGSCKFIPSCSEYAVEALQKHGPLHGTLLAVRRLARCHPFSPGGIDHVPDATSRHP
jgi:hypothetical protein